MSRTWYPESGPDKLEKASARGSVSASPASSSSSSSRVLPAKLASFLFNDANRVALSLLFAPVPALLLEALDDDEEEDDEDLLLLLVASLLLGASPVATTAPATNAASNGMGLTANRKHPASFMH